MHVRTILALAAALLSTTSFASAGVEKINASQVAYRTRSIAFINRGHGKFEQASLTDAALGSGDRVRYMIVATNQSEQPQVAGVAVSIPDYTEYEPLPVGEADDADIIEWTTDNKHWQTGRPKPKTPRIRGLRWVLTDELGPKMSAAFVFELKLTGPYSDRTGDLNATRMPDAHPVAALTTTEVQEIRDDHVDQVKPAAPAPASFIDPLSFGAQEAKSLKTEWNGLELVELTRRLGVVYRASGSALVKSSDGTYSTIPLEDAHLGEGDKVRYTIVVRNEGNSTQSAGASFNIPPYARYESVESKGDGIIEVTEDGVTWVPEAKLPKDRVRAVRWAYQGELTAREAATFTVQMRVVQTPSAPAPGTEQQANAQSAFRALAPSTIQSVKFTNAVTSGVASTFGGMTIGNDLAKDVQRTVDPGVVRSDATPVPTATPEAASAANQPAPSFDASAVGAIAAGIGLIVVVFMFMKARNGTGAPAPKVGGRGVSFTAPSGGGVVGMIKRGRLQDDREEAERV